MPGRDVAGVDRGAGRVRPAGGEHVEHRDHELAEDGLEIRVAQPQAGDPVYPPLAQSRPLTRRATPARQADMISDVGLTMPITLELSAFSPTLGSHE